METQELRTLKILEAVEQEETPSQRDLAKRLNVSLGLVNSFIKRLVNKGYFKITTIPRNRVRYILTPKGAAEKTRLTYAYLAYSFDFYRQARRKMQALFKDLSTQGVRRIAFYGATDLAEIGFLCLQETSIELVGVFDEERKGEQFLGGRKVGGYRELMSAGFDRVIITSIETMQADYEGLCSSELDSEKVSKAL